MTQTPWPDSAASKWLDSRVDPFRAHLLRTGLPDLDEVLGLLPKTEGPAAFDAEVIASSVERLGEK